MVCTIQHGRIPKDMFGRNGAHGIRGASVALYAGCKAVMSRGTQCCVCLHLVLCSKLLQNQISQYSN